MGYHGQGVEGDTAVVGRVGLSGASDPDGGVQGNKRGHGERDITK